MYFRRWRRLRYGLSEGSGKVNEYRFRFTSGSTPTVLTLPDGTVGGIDVQADTVYEVTLHDGYLKYHSWAVNGT